MFSSLMLWRVETEVWSTRVQSCCFTETDVSTYFDLLLSLGLGSGSQALLQLRRKTELVSDNTSATQPGQPCSSNK